MKYLRAIYFCLVLVGVAVVLTLFSPVPKVRGNGKHPIIDETPTLRGTIRDDWLVNDDTMGGCDQFTPSIVSTKDGYIGVWEDWRNGYDSDIYVGHFDFNGSLIGAPIRVNDDTGSNCQGDASVGVDSAGNFVVVWEDKRNGDQDIYGQRYDYNGTPIGGNFRIDDDPSGKMQYEPSVAVGKDGKFMVVWRDDRERHIAVYAQIYDARGTPIGSNFKVNSGGNSNSAYNPSVSVAPDNEFAVVWADVRERKMGIYCQRYTNTGTPVGGNFKVTDNPDISRAMRKPFISYNYSDIIVVVWQDYRDHRGYSNIYGQLYDSTWTPINANFRISDASSLLTSQTLPQVSIDGDGNFVVTWSDHRNNHFCPDVYAQRYDNTGSPKGSNFKVNKLSPGRQRYTNSAIGMNPTTGDFIIVWQDITQALDAEILAQLYDSEGGTVENNFSLIPDEGMGRQKQHQVSMNEDGNFIIVWEDTRYNKKVIFAQRYDSLGNPIGPNWEVTNISKAAYSPSVAINSEGVFVITWVYEEPNHTTHIYARKYSSSGTPLGPEFQVDDTLSSSSVLPQVAINDKGNFVITWQDHRNSGKYCDIYAQIYSPEGAVGTNFLVNEVAGIEACEHPDIAMDEKGNFIIVWQQSQPTPLMPFYDVYGQWFDSTGTPIGGNFLITDDPVLEHQQLYPSVALHKDGNFAIVWEDTREEESWITDIYCQIYDINGVKVGSNFRINRDDGDVLQVFPSVTFHSETKELIVVWTDHRTKNPQIMAQKVDSLGSLMGSNFLINNPESHPCNSHISTTGCIASNDIQIVVSWIDNRRFKGQDIYSKLINWEPEKVEEKEVIPTMELNIYPNPVVKELFIKYNIRRKERCLLSIYDRSGRKVEEINLLPRITTLDVSTFTSGVYFLKFQIKDKIFTKKITILH
jgi:hypothetical protein